MRHHPVLEGLKKLSARRPVRQILLGMSLIVPATAFMARVPDVGTMSSLAQQQEERSRADLIASVWREATGVSDEAATTATVAGLADEYNVSVPMASDIHEAAVAESIDPKIAFGLVRAESKFQSTIVSPVGAIGLTQVMPATAKWLIPGTSRTDLKDPEVNLKVGFKYLRSLLDQFEGNEKLALTAYNRGPGTVSKILDKGGDPDNGYAEMVLTGKSAKHVRLMNAKFGKKAVAKTTTKRVARTVKKATRREG